VNFSYTPESDEELMSICGGQDEQGNLMDINQTLYHSVTTGFYLKSSHGQIKKGGRWNTIVVDPSKDDAKSENFTANRRVITVFRLMTPEQSVSWIVSSSLPVDSNCKDLLLKALTARVVSDAQS